MEEITQGAAQQLQNENVILKKLDGLQAFKKPVKPSEKKPEE